MIGVERQYSATIPTSDPRAVLNGNADLIDLSNNTVKWSKPLSFYKTAKAITILLNRLTRRQMSYIPATVSRLLYPIYNASSFLVAIAAHVTISNNVKDRKDQAVIKHANRILENHADTLNTIALSDLYTGMIKHLQSKYAFNSERDENTPEAHLLNGGIIRSKPVF